MTSKETIDLFKSKLMAVQALEQEPCEDAISRKEAIEVLKNNYRMKALDEIQGLPSVQPKPMECEDCISRKAVIALAKEECDTAIIPYRRFVKDINALPSVTPKPKWIPVSDRLPENNGVYIVSRWFSDGEESAILTDANYYDGCGEWYNDNRINWGRKLVTDKIVAWMPLPEPYKAESEDKK